MNISFQGHTDMLRTIYSLVTQIGMIKKKPAKPPTGTHRLMAVGTLMLGSAHSSALRSWSAFDCARHARALPLRISCR